MPDLVLLERLAPNLIELRLNRPERRNALVPELVTVLLDQLRLVAGQRPAPRALLLTGAGHSFCVGADLKWLASLSDPGQGVQQLVGPFHQVIETIQEAPVPVVAAVNGAAAGGGLGLALAADYRVAAESASFTTAYFRLGLPPDGGSSAFLAWAIGSARAMELLLTNQTLSAREAHAWGLVNEVCPDGELIERSCTAASRFAAVPGGTLLATRGLLDRATSRSLRKQLEAEASAICLAARSETFRQAVAAFAERRS